MTYRHFKIKFKDKFLPLSTLIVPGGKLEQYLPTAEITSMDRRFHQFGHSRPESRDNP